MDIQHLRARVILLQQHIDEGRAELNFSVWNTYDAKKKARKLDEICETKRGEEELTREIPNVSEDAVKNLDEVGVIRIGAIVRPGDILVGKVTPKGRNGFDPRR